jgi:diguanylate cyclase (GGDEF)-like protein
MSAQRKIPRWLQGSRPRLIALAILSCVAGIIAGSIGGFPAVIVALVTAAALGFVSFRFIDEKEKRPESPIVSPRHEPTEQKVIPPDRIDPLTGLANENGLMAWFAEKAARIEADGKGIIVLAADLADFERIERSRGKKTADAILVEVAGRVATCTGQDGIAARTSGDEFAAIATIVPERSEEAAAEQAGKLAELIQRPVELSSGVVWIGGSVGASFGAVHDGPVVLEEARKALKRAKVLGLGHYVVYKPDMPG